MVGALPPEVEVILPCLNEAEALGWVLGRMPPWVRPIVVDNGSTDGSAEIARDHGAQVVYAPQRGYGAACHAGLLGRDGSSRSGDGRRCQPEPRAVGSRRGARHRRYGRSRRSAAAAQSTPQPSRGRCGSRTGSWPGGSAGVPASSLPTLVRCEPLSASRCWRCRSGTGGPATRPRRWYAPPMRDGESLR